MKYNDGSKIDTRHNVGYLIAASVCAVLIMAAALCFFMIANAAGDEDLTIPEFQNALNTGDYSKALEIYRGIQDEVVSMSPEEAEAATKQTELLDEMEDIVGQKVEDICSKIRYERYTPSDTEVEFLEQMQELTSSLVSVKLNGMCEEFLLGTMEKPDIIFVFNQLSPISNFSATTGPLLREIDYIETARGDVQAAEDAYDSEDYITAVKSYRSILENYDGFVYNFSEERVEEIKTVMYDPMIVDCEHMLETYKYYTAEEELSDLAEIFPDDDRVKNDLLEATSNTTETYEYTGYVPVLCVRSLIADKETAFSKPLTGSNNDLYITCDEFRKVLEGLYANDYILVDAEAKAGIEYESYMIENPLIVPVGKKPVVIVIENLVYSAKQASDGVCTRLTVNDNGEVLSEYRDSDGNTISGKEYEAIGILDMFVSEHTDFTYDGAKGVISVSGYESVFGYVINEDEADDRNAALSAAGLDTQEFSQSEIEANVKTVKNIVDILSDTGWKFASCTYGYINAKQADMETIQADTEKWMTQIGQVLGDVHMLVYPGGNYIDGTDDRAEYLKSQNLRIFFGTGTTPYSTYGYNYLYYDRIMVSYWTLRRYDFSAFFNVDDVMDPDRTTTSTDDSSEQ